MQTYRSLVRAYKILIWDFRDMIFFTLRSSKYPYGTIVCLQNGWRCVVVLNDHSLNVVLRVLNLDTVPNVYLFMIHVKGAYMIGEVLSTDGNVLMKTHQLQSNTLPDSAISPVKADVSMIIESLLELRVMLDLPQAKLYKETCFVNEELHILHSFYVQFSKKNLKIT